MTAVATVMIVAAQPTVMIVAPEPAWVALAFLRGNPNGLFHLLCNIWK